MTFTGHRYTFLVVDDNYSDQKFIRDSLNEHIENPHIVEAHTFRSAKTHLTKGQVDFDAILLDPSLPKNSGEPLVSKMMHLCTGTPIIILTKNRDESLQAASCRLGISDYLIKNELTSSELYRSILFNIEHCKTLSNLQDSEKRYSDLFHLSPIPMFVVGIRDSQFLDVNKAAINHYGYSKIEFLSMTFEDIRPDDNPDKIKNSSENIDFSQPFNGTDYHSKKNGSKIYVDIQTNPITFKGRDAHIILANDITDQVKYIQAIQKQNDKLKKIAWIQSHVVRAPLARMMGIINILKDDIPTNLTQQELLDYLMISANELDSIIRDISEKSEEVDYFINKARNI